LIANSIKVYDQQLIVGCGIENLFMILLQLIYLRVQVGSTLTAFFMLFLKKAHFSSFF